MVEISDSFDHVESETLHLEFLREQVELEERTNVFFSLGLTNRFCVQPTHHQLKWVVILVRKAVRLVPSRFLLFFLVVGIEDGGEVRGVVSEEALVDCPVRRLRADVDIDEGRGQKPALVLIAIPRVKKSSAHLVRPRCGSPEDSLMKRLFFLLTLVLLLLVLVVHSFGKWTWVCALELDDHFGGATQITIADLMTGVSRGKQETKCAEEEEERIKYMTPAGTIRREFSRKMAGCSSTLTTHVPCRGRSRSMRKTSQVKPQFQKPTNPSGLQLLKCEQ